MYYGIWRGMRHGSSLILICDTPLNNTWAMVLFANINVGQKVQVFYSDAIHTGIVKYKGGLANTKGDWVGVELDKPGK